MELALQQYMPMIENFKIDDIINIQGICVCSTYIAPNKQYGIYLFEDINGYDFPVLSNTTALVIGQSYFLRGKVVEYQYQKELKLYDFIPYKPTTKHAILSFLSAIPGLQSKAELIYNNFGEKAIDVVISNPEKLSVIKGVGDKTVEKVKDANVGFNVDYQTILSLYDLGFSTNQVIKVIKEYGDQIIFRLHKNPYNLMDLPSFSYTFCDKLAAKLGFSPDSPCRMNAAGISILENASFEGNVYLPNNEFLPLVQNLLSIKLQYGEIAEHLNEKTFSYFGKTYVLDKEKMKECLNKKQDYMLETFSENDILQSLVKSVIKENEKVYLKKLYDAEVSFAYNLKKSVDGRNAIYSRKKIENILDKICKQDGIELEHQQREAVIACCKYDSGPLILNGFAGTGKTFVTKIIVKTKMELQYMYHPNEELSFLGLAPTGKASKVMSKSMNELHIPCETMHHALEFDGTSFHKDAKNKFTQNCFIIDESSMIDIMLANAFLKAVPDKSMIIFLGDTKQLASVGPGAVLRDMIQSHALPVITLNVVKRQTALSGILKNAEHVIAKEMLETTPITDDFYLMKTDSNEETQIMVSKAIDRLFEKGFTVEEIQLLIPQRAGEIGIYYMNYLLQKKLNKNNKGIMVPKTTFEIGTKSYNLFICKNDKVMQIKNDWSRELFKKKNGVLNQNTKKLGITNGEIGIVSDIYVNKSGETIVQVKFDDYYTEYNDVSSLELAYAVTIHKSQGSQWPATLIIVGNIHRFMLSNNILYTAITRSVDFCGIIYNESALRYAIKTEKDSKRYTTLDLKLMEYE